MLRKPPIGVSDFQEVWEKNHLYVDKSLLIREILDSPAKILFLPRPRRFGKTLNLSLLRHFFEKPACDSPAADIFSGLAISRHPECMEHKGRYPVVFLTFKDIKERNFEDCFRKVQSVLAEEYRRHKAVLEAILDKNERTGMDKVLAKAATQADTEEALLQLTKFLHRATGEKVILLIDEYDTPIHSAHANDYYEDVIHFVRNLLGGALKDNVHVEKGVLTGILRVARESLFSGLNNLAVHTLLSSEFSDKFGFTEAETEQLLADRDRSSDLDAVREWYNGYRFGETVIYNPWSILNFVASREDYCKPYWINTSDNALIRDLIVSGDPDLHGELEALLGGKAVRSHLHEHISLRDVEQNRETVFSFLVHCGYLKVTGRSQEGLRQIYDLALPNLETRFFYEDVVASWLGQAVGDRRLKQMLVALTTKDIETFGALFQELIVGIFSFHDLPRRRSEQALAQLREKDYAAELREKNVERFFGLGVVFRGKRVYVRETELGGA